MHEGLHFLAVIVGNCINLLVMSVCIFNDRVSHLKWIYTNHVNRNSHWFIQCLLCSLLVSPPGTEMHI